MALYDGAGDRLAGNLSLIVDNYEAERQRYWSDDSAEASLIRIMDIVAKAMLTGSSDMVFDASDREPWEGSESPWDDMAKAVQREGYSAHLVESIEIPIAEDTVSRLFDAPARCLDLASHILSAQPAEPVRRYLARLGRCYIAGFLPESVILCRAVLENAVNEAFDRRGGSGGAVPHKMSLKLKHCEGMGWLTSQGRSDAMNVWVRGNTAVHNDPEATRDVLGTIVLTMGVLGQLYEDA